ncbi:chemotaxis protein CheW [Parasulfuritortus cantonensis]|uniref:Chemotaxis protein CheW n=1 Tax=Parasulfuritortus cantonensis TaxID=2528202 RepID=A0A4R1BIU3_9PROT|nr:chemotaxis protein CheW [Parasulfuritortus cantonensis]TCJ17216.1 chemotaxis protein CheW [Parasulfuritortus cantonensis]
MEERLNLREFQSRLAERLKASAEQTGEAAKLGFLAGGRYWLTALDQVSEVVTVTRLARTPWTRPWFLGVAGVRGTIYGCTDLAAFLGLASAETPDEVRLLLANPRFGAHAAFRVDQALGLRNSADMERIPRADDDAPWLLTRFRDGDGTEWTEIALEGMLAEPRFLRVA